jgi:hypothetical protein
MLCLGALAPRAQADFSLLTLSGGPNETNSAFTGYADGPIDQDGRGPQYNGPVGLTVGGGNSFLLIADKTNRAVRRIDLTSSTFDVTTVTRNGLTNPVAVLLDPAGQMYVLNEGAGGANGRVLMFDSINFTNLIKTNISGLSLPTAMAMDSSTNLYVCVSTGAVFKVSNTATSTVAIIPGGSVALRGIAVRDDGKIAVTDAGNHVIWLIDPAVAATPAGNNVSLMAGLPGTSGTAYGASGLARFNQPHGIAKAGGGLLIVADRQNHRVSVVDSTGMVTNLYGVASNLWVYFDDPSIYPGWADVPPSNNRGEAREPVGVAVGADGTVYASELYYHLIRQADGVGITGPSDGSGGGGGTNGIVVPPPTITPDRGYFPMGVTITVNSSVPDVFYTTDGTDPTTNSTRVVIDGNVGSLVWSSPTNDLTGLRLRAFSGTNASVVVTGQPISLNVVGVPPTINTNFYAGIGSTIVVPVIVSLEEGQQLRTIQFNVFVIATNGAPSLVSPLQAITITTNDFVQLPLPSNDELPVTLSSIASADTDAFANDRRRIAVFTTTSDNLLVEGSAAVALISVPIPSTALEGDTYILQVRNASGTADGGPTDVVMQQLSDRLITVANVSYLVGDSSPGRWYNAGDFGNPSTTNLNNSDVNAGFLASFGLQAPYTFTDAFNTMDTFPEDTPGFVGGDGILGFLDWSIIQARSLRLPGQDANNWYRAWSTGGVRVNTAGPVSLARGLATTAPGDVWNRQAMIGSPNQGNKSAGNSVSLPVYVKLASGSSLAGFQFRAVVTASPGAPAVTEQVTFTSVNIPAPNIRYTNGLNDIVRAWYIGALSLTQPSNQVGTIQFRIPAGAQTGDSYSVSFIGADGAPDLSTLYKFESKAGTVWVGEPAPATDAISDDWKVNFFGASDAAEAGAAEDPDGDGVTNWQEYLAGTDPSNGNSRLEVSITNSGVVAVLQWLTAPGKAYAVEYADTLLNPVWTQVGEKVTGDGQLKQVTQTHDAAESRFYRVRLTP